MSRRKTASHITILIVIIIFLFSGCARYSLNTEVNPSDSGVIDITSPADKYKSGTIVTLNAIPEDGMVFDYWDLGVGGTSPSVTVTITSNLRARANFKPSAAVNTTSTTTNLTQITSTTTISSSTTSSVSVIPSSTNSTIIETTTHTRTTVHVVKVFISPRCVWCGQVLEFLDKNGVKYDVIDVTKNPSAFSEVLDITHLNTVPQTYIDGTVVIGFDEAQLKEKLVITD